MLEPLGVELVIAPSTDSETLAALARESVAMLVCYAPIPREVVTAAAEGGCRVIARYGIGYENVDVEAATEAGIVVTNVPDYCIEEVADHTFALLLAAARGVVRASELVRAGDWERGSIVHSLRGRQLTLVGLGRIGTATAQRALAFGLRVVAYDPLVSTSRPEIELAESLEDALAEADFVSLHLPLSMESHHLIGDRAIGLMGRAPILVNTSRGGLVDLDAVRLALDDNRLDGVALDVTEPEPLPAGHPLRRHPKAIVTPHMAFYSEEAQAELQRRVAEEAARALRGEPPRSPVNADGLAAARS